MNKRLSKSSSDNSDKPLKRLSDTVKPISVGDGAKSNKSSSSSSSSSSSKSSKKSGKNSKKKNSGEEIMKIVDDAAEKRGRSKTSKDSKGKNKGSREKNDTNL